MKPVIVSADMLTPYGRGTDACWKGLLSGQSALSRVSRFKTAAFHSDYAGIISGLRYHERESLVMQMLRTLFAGTAVPEDAKLMLATTKGEIDLLEQSMLENKGDVEEAIVSRLISKVAELTSAKGGGLVLSAACTSSAAAAAQAAAMVRNGHADCVLVVACDSVTEFIVSGFSSLMALDKQPARPFDRNRAGLNVGEAAAYALIMSEERAVREGRPVLGTIAGWGLSDDANHMTGPSRESEGLVLAIRKAFVSAGIRPADVGLIAAHGTGTVYNDQMEMRAFRAVFTDGPRPVYSIKGGIGHTMGAAGLVEMLIAQRALREGIVPPTVNLIEVDDDARGWASDRPQPVRSRSLALMTNAGFSGINTALVLDL
ncbi:MAG: beta-ketoacyl-[acyl-carrier-protein] synthase family protein [Nitrospirae bacterium]|nr:beta-ketoacyl-[acyl-carrier-protein] synthase family protein [Nitrospirota bacterium]